MTDDRAKGALSRFIRWVMRDTRYHKLYPCTVEGQSSDLMRLDLSPDDAEIRGTGLSGVPIRLGLPGIKVKVSAGARVMLGFDAGDPRRPYAALWDADGKEHVERIDFGDSPQDAARKGDTVEVLLVPAIFTGTISGAPATGVVSWAAPKTLGTIVTGTPRFRLGV